MENARNAASGALTDINKVKHFHECSVARIGNAAGLSGCQFYAEITGIGYSDKLALFDNDQALTPVVIRVDQAVGQRLADSLVYRRVIDTEAAFHLKRRFDIELKTVIHAVVEIEKIAAPVAGR